jgi:hypothetical protein
MVKRLIEFNNGKMDNIHVSVWRIIFQFNTFNKWNAAKVILLKVNDVYYKYFH